MQPEELLSLAVKLAADNNEAHLRTAANRAYYFVHHLLLPIAEELPEVKVPPVPGRVGHREVMYRLESWKHPNSKLQHLKHAAGITSKTLKAMIAVREKADYHLFDYFSSQDVELQLKRAGSVAAFVTRVDADKIKVA